MTTLATLGTVTKDIFRVDEYIYVITDEGLDVYLAATGAAYSTYALSNVTCGFASTAGVWLGTSDAGVYFSTVPVVASTAILTQKYTTTTTPAIESDNVTGIFSDGVREVVTTDTGIDFIVTGSTVYNYTGALSNGFKTPAIFGSKLVYGVSATDGGGVHYKASLPSADWGDSDVTLYEDWPHIDEDFTAEPDDWTDTQSDSTASITWGVNGMSMSVGPSAPGTEYATLDSDFQFSADAEFVLEFDVDDFPAAAMSTGQAAYFQVRSAGTAKVICDLILLTDGSTKKWYYNYADVAGTNQNANTARTVSADTLTLGRRFSGGTYEVYIASGTDGVLVNWVDSWDADAGGATHLFIRAQVYTTASQATATSIDVTRFEITSMSTPDGSAPMVTPPSTGFYLNTKTVNDIKVGAELFVASSGGVAISDDVVNNVTFLTSALGSDTGINGIDPSASATTSSGTIAFVTDSGVGLYNLTTAALSNEGATGTAAHNVAYLADHGTIVHDG